MTLFTKAQAAWNSGMSDEKAKAEGFEQEFIALEKKYGCASIPLCDLPTKREPTEAELKCEVSRGVTYGDWKGITGPGKQLREMCAQPKQKQFW